MNVGNHPQKQYKYHQEYPKKSSCSSVISNSTNVSDNINSSVMSESNMAAVDYGSLIRQHALDKTEINTLNLKSLKNCKNGEKVNILVMFIHGTPPSETKGTDFSSRWSLWDPSLSTNQSHKPTESIIMNMFRKMPSDIPNLTPGTPILCRNIHVGFFNQKIQLRSSVSSGTTIEVLFPSFSSSVMKDQIEPQKENQEFGSANKLLNTNNNLKPSHASPISHLLHPITDYLLSQWNINKIKLSNKHNNNSFMSSTSNSSVISGHSSGHRSSSNENIIKNNQNYAATTGYRPASSSIVNINSNEYKTSNSNDSLRRHHTVSFLDTQNLVNSNKRRQLTLSEIRPDTQFFDFVGEVVSVKPYLGKMDIHVTDYSENKMFYEKPEEGFCYIIITLWDSVSDKASAMELEPKELVLLKNLHMKMKNGEFKINLREDRLNLDKILVQRVHESAEIASAFCQNKREWAAIHGPPTEIYDKNITFQHIEELLKVSGPSKHEIRGWVVDHLPSNITHFTRLACRHCPSTFPSSFDSLPKQCKYCKHDLDENNFIFRFSLLLDDTSGHLPVLISDEEAIDFLRGLRPCNLFKEPQVVEDLKNRLSRLWDVKNSEEFCPVQNPRPFNLCVESFLVESEEDGERFVQFKLFNTCLNIV